MANQSLLSVAKNATRKVWRALNLRVKALETQAAALHSYTSKTLNTVDFISTRQAALAVQRFAKVEASFNELKDSMNRLVDTITTASSGGASQYGTPAGNFRIL